MKRWFKSDKIFDFFMYLLLGLALLIAVYPIILVTSASFSDPDFVNNGKVLLLPKGFRTVSYQLVLKDKRILTGYVNTIFYTVTGTILSVIVTIMAAYPLSQKDIIGHKFITWFFLIPMYISGGLIPTYLQVNRLGLVGSRSSMIIVGCLSIWNLIICRSFYASALPKELNEAAEIDGASTFQYFFKVVVPNTKAIVAIMVLYYAVAQWNEFFKALLYLNDSKQYPLQLILRDILLASQSVSVDASPEMYALLIKQSESMKYAIIVISSLPVICIYPFIQKYFVKGVMVGSVKG